MKRPVGITLLSIYLGYLVSRGFEHWQTVSHSPLTHPDVTLDLLRVAIMLAAGFAAVGLWRMRSWAFRAVAWFAALVLARALIEDLLVGVPWSLQHALVYLYLGAFLGAVVYSVRGSLRKHNEEPVALP